MSKLEVEIGASIDGFKKSMSKVLKEFDQVKQVQGLLEKQFKSGKISADNYYKSIAGLQAQKVKLSSDSTKLKNSLLGTQQAVKGVGRETSVNALPALNEFSRVIQDAPYGIQGVANNITQLTTQFGYLTKKTGGSKAALKAMLGSLTGPAGILLAISAVTSLLVFFSDKLFSSSKNADKLKSSSKGVNEELKSQSAILKELIKNFDQFNKIRITARFNTIKEREELKALNLNVLDYTESEETRIRALKQLIKLYPRYFKGLDISQTTALIKAEDAVNKALLRKEKLKKTLIKLEEATQKLENNSIELNEKRGSFNIKDVERVKVLNSQNVKLRDQIKLLREALELFVSGTNFKELKEYTGQMEKLNVSLKGSVAALETQKNLLENEQIQVSTNSKTWKEYENRIQAVQDKIDAIKKGIKPIVVPITIGQPAGLTGVDTGGVGDQLVGLNLAEIIKPIDEAKIQMQAALLEFNNAASQIINNNIVNTFAGIGEAIGNAMSGAGNLGKNLTKVLLGSIGNLLQQLGKLAIKAGITLKAVKIALENLRPEVAIAAGIAAVAVGKAFSNSAARLGGSTGTGSVAGAGSSGGFSSGTTFGGARPFSGNLTFTIRGTDLVAVLNSANSQNGIIGGNVSVG